MSTTCWKKCQRMCARWKHKNGTTKYIPIRFFYGPVAPHKNLGEIGLGSLQESVRILSRTTSSRILNQLLHKGDKYESFTKNAAAQIYALTQELNAGLLEREVSIPVFAAASRVDTSVNSTATQEFMARARHPSSKLVLYTTDVNNRPADIPAEKLELVNSALPAQKILSSAHTAILLPPEDAHYGAAGEYSNCIHYYPADMGKYDKCNNNPKDDLQGELTEENLKTGIMRRLMYNPNFAELKIALKRFMDGLP